MSPLYRLLRFTLRHPLNRGGKAKAIVRVLRWQIGTRYILEATK